MNTRQAIQPSNAPTVLSLSFSSSRNRFITGLSDGIRTFRTDNCLATYEPSTTIGSPYEGSIAIAEALDDRYMAFVPGGRLKVGSESAVVFWDCVLEKEVTRLDFSEPVLGVKVCGKWMTVVLKERSVVFSYQEIAPQQEATPPPDDSEDDDVGTEKGEEELIRGPNKVHALHATSPNPFALACLRNNLLILPAQTVGQVQLVPLPSGSKRVLRAHNSALRCMALSPSGNLLATTSEQGTLIRVFDTRNLDQVTEFRRGVEKAIIFGLAISEGERWLACTSDKGTVHVFDLRPPPPPIESTPTAAQKTTQHRKSPSYASHRLSGGERETTSILSGGRSSPTTAITTGTATYQGSIQEYYGLRPPPVSPTAPPAIPSAVAAFKQSSWAPKVLKDVRSVASTPFYMGDESPYWQGGVPYSWTTAPGGTRKRVRNAVPGMPNDPAGKPPKGLVAFAPKNEGREEDDGAVLYVIGGGTDARWEVFDLAKREDGGWVLVRRGFRKYLTRQFVD